MAFWTKQSSLEDVSCYVLMVCEMSEMVCEVSE